MKPVQQKRQKETREEIPFLKEKFEAIRVKLSFGTPKALMDAIVEKCAGAGLRVREFHRQVYEAGKMNSTYQYGLAEFTGFDPECRAWKEGSLEDFQAELNRLLDGDGAILVEDARYVSPDKRESDLAMLVAFAPSQAQNAGPGAAHISFTLHCPQLSGGNLVGGVKAGWLVFDLGTAKTCHARDRTGFDGKLQCNNAKVQVYDPDFHRPSWFLASGNGQALGMISDVPVDFLTAWGLKPNGIVRGEFHICVSDIGVSFPVTGTRAESQAKAKLRQRLKQRQIVEDDDGKAVIAINGIKFIDRPEQK